MPTLDDKNIYAPCKILKTYYGLWRSLCILTKDRKSYHVKTRGSETNPAGHGTHKYLWRKYSDNESFSVSDEKCPIISKLSLFQYGPFPRSSNISLSNPSIGSLLCGIVLGARTVSTYFLRLPSSGILHSNLSYITRFVDWETYSRDYFLENRISEDCIRSCWWPCFTGVRYYRNDHGFIQLRTCFPSSYMMKGNMRGNENEFNKRENTAELT